MIGSNDCGKYTAHRCRSKDDDSPRGNVHGCDPAGNVTDCGKEIPQNGTWYIGDERVTCPKCLKR